jgi:hypothetical protein
MQNKSCLDDLRALDRDLHDALSRAMENMPLVQLRSVFKSSKLLVLAQHQASDAVDARQILAILKRALQQMSFATPLPDGSVATTLAVQLYLRVMGTTEPYASHGFEILLQPQFDVTESWLTDDTESGLVQDNESEMISASGVSDSVLASGAEGIAATYVVLESDDGNGEYPAEVAVESDGIDSPVSDAFAIEQDTLISENQEMAESQDSGDDQEDFSLLSSNARPLPEEVALPGAEEEAGWITVNPSNPSPTGATSDIQVAQRTEPQAEQPSPSLLALLYDTEEEPEPPPKPRQKGSWMKLNAIASLGIVVGVAAIVGGLYMLTRPCVIGRCLVIDQAQQTHDTVVDQLEVANNAELVSEAYEQLLDASYELGKIPSWSPHRATAQQLIADYGNQADSIQQVIDAQASAYSAAVKSQNPPHPLETWLEVQTLWQDAIAQLKEVSPDSPVYGLAQRKLEEYRTNLDAINRRIELEQDDQARVKSAREAAQLAEAREGASTSTEALQAAYTTWQQAMNLLNAVRTDTMSYAEAQQLIALYTPKLGQVRDRLTQEDISSAAYDQAQRLAELATDAESRGQWSEAVIYWRDALNNAQQVPSGTSYSSLAQPLVIAYQASLQTAQDNLQTAIALQTAQADLTQLCNTTPPVCTYQVVDNTLQVQATAAYAQQAGLATFPNQTNPSPSVSMNELLRAIAAISDQAEVAIAFHNADGSLFGTYMPAMNGYIPPDVPIDAAAMTSP